jgi:hypothetical protein
VLPRPKNTAPNFVEKLQSVKTSHGYRVTLRAVAQGTPVPNMTWLKDGHALSNEIEVTHDGRGGSTATFVATAETSGWYQCTAFNAAGSSISRARVAVDLPPEPAPAPPMPKLDIPRTGRIIEPE